MGEALSTLFLLFYCLPIPNVIFLVFFFTVVFQALKKHYTHHLLWKIVLSASLIMVVMIIVFATVSSRETGGVYEHRLVPFHSYREVMNGGNIEILRSNFMNVVLFYPAGLILCSLLPEKWSGWCRVLVVFVVFCALSGGIEYAQYAYSLGWVEIDDVIHNSLGALLGSIFSIVPLEPWRWFQIVSSSK